MAKRKPTNLVRRGDVFYFRTAIPKQIRRAFERLEFKVSLRTTDLQQARYRQQWIGFLWENVTQALSSMAALTPHRINQIVRDYFAQEVQNFVLHAEEGPRSSSFEIGREIDDAAEFLAALEVRIGSRKYTESDVHTAVGLLEKAQLAVPPKGSDGLDEVCNKTLRARAESVRIFVALLKGRHHEAQPRDPLFIESVAPPAIDTEWGEQRTALGDLAREYVAEHRKTWAAKTVIDKERVNRWFVEMVGEATAVSEINSEHIRQFKALLMKLPANLAKHKTLKFLPLMDAVKAAAPMNLPTLSLRTADKYLGMLGAFFQWSCDNNHIKTSPVGRISVPFKRAMGVGAKDSYSIQQLNTLFSSPLYAGHKSKTSRHLPGPIHTRDGKFWIPPIALFSGMRAGEIIQLQLQDIRLIEKVWLFDVNKGEDGKKSLKTLSSKRQVPIHPSLIQLGFLEFVEELRSKRNPSDRLFPDIKLGKYGDPSHAFSKWFGRVSKLIGLKTGKTTFHSFRHTFVDAVRATAVAEYVLEALTGHSSGKVSSGYGSGGTPIQVKADAVAAIKFPGLDLSKLG